MRLKIDKHIFILILLFAVIHFLLSLFYAYSRLGADFILEKKFFQMLMGGIRVEDSMDLFCVILYVLPRCLFCIYVGNFFIKELKINFVYIFSRTGKRSRWLNAVFGKMIRSVLYYEGFFVAFVFVCKGVLTPKMHPIGIEFVNMIVLEILQVLVITIFSGMILMFITEAVSVLITLLALILPVLIIGVIYDSNGVWEPFAKYIPFNLGNYNYMVSTGMNQGVVMIAMMAICVIFYIVSRRHLQNYEVI